MGGGYIPNSGRPHGGQIPSYSFSSLVPVRHWARDPALRSWPVLLLVALVCVPPIALVLLNNPTEARIHVTAWIFAAYFAVAWLLLLGVIVRPQHVHRAMLAAVAVIGIVTQAPTAIFLETQLHSSTGSLLDVFTIGIPEELAKAIPIVAVAWIWRREWHTQTPRDYLFLGAVSGLVFGAAEAVHYFTNVLGSLSGNVNGLDLQDLTIQYIWRFLTDPIDHAMWAGITGYFIGLAITGQNRKYSIGLIGIVIAAVLHGLNDWNAINAHGAWVLITLISVLLFLGYARAGAWLPQQALASSPDLAPSAPGPPGSVPPAPWAAGSPGQVPPAHPGPAGYGAPAGHGAPAGYGAPAGHGAPAGYGPPAMPEQASPAGPPVSREAWWQHPPAAGGRTVPPPPQPAHASPAPSDATAPHATAPHAAVPHSAASQPTVVPRKSAPKPWWEQ
jgi:RsiW-degrading membrane proteinase PrsW (M82 family)